MTQSAREKIGGYSNMVVGATIGLGLLYFIWHIFDWRFAVALGVYLLYEGWTLINRFPEDTLSESVWRLAARPMVPYLFGMAMGAWACWICVRPMLGRPITPESVLQFGGTMFLMGHFFFQAQRENKKLVVQDAADVVEETVGREAAERVKTAAAVQK